MANKKYVRINRENLYIRMGPGKDYDVIGAAHKNDEYPYVETDSESGWHRIGSVKWIGNAKTDGWVSGRFTSIFEDE